MTDYVISALFSDGLLTLMYILHGLFRNGLVSKTDIFSAVRVW